MLYVSFHNNETGRRIAQAYFDMAGRILTSSTFRMVEEWTLDLAVRCTDLDARFHFCRLEDGRPEQEPFICMRARTVAEGDKRTTVLTVDDKTVRISTWDIHDAR